MKIFVAGVEQTVKPQLVLRYVAKYPTTTKQFDLRAGKYQSIDSDLICATRVISSRISNDELTWFESTGRSAPWGLVDSLAKLVDADPGERGGQYDRALELWNQFASNKKRGVAVGKISKVLHAMRPNFFPIIDSRLRRSYRAYARECATLALPHHQIENAYWAAIREDLLKSDEALSDLRDELASPDNPAITRWVSQVSDVRLHDVVAWSLTNR